jgi:hypothetical protein
METHLLLCKFRGGKEKLTTTAEEQKKIRASHHEEKVWMEEIISVMPIFLAWVLI